MVGNVRAAAIRARRSNIETKQKKVPHSRLGGGGEA